MPLVTVLPEAVEVELEPGETLLGGLTRAGYAYRFGCRRGGCGLCKVDLVAGEVTYERPVADSVLPDEQRRHGTCLSCRAVPAGDVVIALREDHLRRVNPFAPAIRPRPSRAGTT
jgi:ferredoxin